MLRFSPSTAAFVQPKPKVPAAERGGRRPPRPAGRALASPCPENR